MSQVVRAVYENGILRPLDQLDLVEHQQVRVTVDPVGAGASDDRRPEAFHPLSGLRVSTGIVDLAEKFDDHRFGRAGS